MINIIGLTSIYIQLPIIKTIRETNNEQPIEGTILLFARKDCHNLIVRYRNYADKIFRSQSVLVKIKK
jgi:type III secretory pathway component EscR